MNDLILETKQLSKEFLGESVSLIMGLIFIICVMAFRKGIVGELKAKLTRSGTNLKGGSGLLEKT